MLLVPTDQIELLKQGNDSTQAEIEKLMDHKKKKKGYLQSHNTNIDEL